MCTLTLTTEEAIYRQFDYKLAYVKIPELARCNCRADTDINKHWSWLDSHGLLSQ